MKMSGTFVVYFVVMIFIFYETSSAKSMVSSCGSIRNIRYPFSIATHYHSTQNSDWPQYDLFCEDNRTVIYLPYDHCNYKLFNYKYYVEAIDYSNYTIRLVDSNIVHDNICSLPTKILFSNSNYPTTKYYRTDGNQLSQSVTFLRCEKQINRPNYIHRTSCTNSSKTSHYYSYAIVDEELTFSDLEDTCLIESTSLISTRKRMFKNFSSFGEVHEELAYGFKLYFLEPYCYIVKNSIHCPYDYNKPFATTVLDIIGYFVGNVLVYIEIPRMICVVIVIAILMYKWYTRHSSMFDGVEEFLQKNNDLMPIRYSYWEIRIMTRVFKDKLGEGGFGSVYKGTLSNGRLVAVKMLGKSKGNGQDFINEVATIGRIHHVNVVRLIGFCATGSKRALVYDFMPNGSLDKYIFSKEGKNTSLSYKEIFEVSLGIARGINYLHQGCDMQILHFDIKPHNILLDDNFAPRVSDFGLARLCPLDNSIVSLTAVRGTIGYIAPELFYKNIGGVSHKADVYSFGMLLMEMANRRKNLNANAENTSEIYFPTWIFDQISEGNDIDLIDAAEEESEIVKKMIIVALWCIQLKPLDRPSMNRVMEMLEGELESLEMPPKPYLYPREERLTHENHDVGESTESSLEEDSTETSLISNTY